MNNSCCLIYRETSLWGSKSVGKLVVGWLKYRKFIDYNDVLLYQCVHNLKHEYMLNIWPGS